MKYIITCILISWGFLGFTQQNNPKEKARNYYFYKSNGRTEVAKDSAVIIQVVSEPDSGEIMYNVQEFYKNGKPRFIGKSSSVHPVTIEGQGAFFYLNGNKKLIATYKMGNIIGNAYSYYPNGKLYLVTEHLQKDTFDINKHHFLYNDSLLNSSYDSTGRTLLEKGNGYFKRYNTDFSRVNEEGAVKNAHRNGEWKGYDDKYYLSYTEQYGGGKLISGISKDSLGVSYSYTERATPAKYPDEQNGINKLLIKNLRYPLGAFKNGQQGRVFCRFVIDPTGKPTKLQVVKAGNDDLDREAIRVLSLMSNWIPATYRGKPVEEKYTIPISFTLGPR